MNKKVKTIIIATVVIGVIACVIGVVEATRVPYVEGTLNQLVHDYYANR